MPPPIDLIPLCFSGLVLAGGRSRRMGTDKSRLILDGESLLARQLRLLAEVGASERLVSVAPGAPPTDWPPGVGRVEDPVADAGPLAGVATGLAAARSPWVLVLAVDLPGLQVDFLRRLLTRAALVGGRGVVPRTAAGWEPLAAVYPAGLATLAASRLAGPDRSLQGFIRAALAHQALEIWEVPAEDRERLVNWNRPGDYPPGPVGGSASRDSRPPTSSPW
ncbi:MAG: molybdenum cofactor guanylyltransferase [Verrucomicrobiota bacterium]